MTAHPNRADLAAYLDMIFGYVEGDGFCIALRGVGEKNTPKEGAPPDVVILPADGDMLADKIFGHVQRWGQHDFASFIVPGAVDGLALADKHATEDRMRLLTTLLVDIDKGDTAERLAWAQAALGQASMIVHSGGTTETGHPKIHAYWRLSEPSDQVAAIAAARKMLALKVGGDTSFGRSTQVVRLPGSVYNKGHAGKACKIEHITKYEYDLGDLLEAIDSMPPAPGLEIDQGKLLPAPSLASYSTGSGLNFSGFKASGSGEKPAKSDIGAVLTTDIHEGGDEERNRWNEFGRVAGMRIADARLGRISLDAAKADALAWMETHMKPAWPAVRFETEWKSLVALDIRHKGAMPGRALEPVEHQPSQPGAHKTLAEWNVETWARGEAPKTRFIVPGLIMAGAQHIFCAGGSIGKTYLMVDLILKIAQKTPGDGARWLGQPLDEAEADGAAVLLTMEDSQDDIHRRIHKLRPQFDRLRGRAIIKPFISAGGAIRFLERERGTHAAVPTHGWQETLNELKEIPNLKLVVIDTLNSTMHDDENNSTVVNEYMQAVAPVVCGELGAALVITHHPRKTGQDSKTRNYSPRDYLNEMRGSGALAASFRAVLGIWDAPDYNKMMRLMGLEPKAHQLFYYGVCKANPDGFFSPDETRVAIRGPIGLLVDVTDQVREVRVTEEEIQTEWLVKAIEVAAADWHPLRKTGVKGVFSRKAQLPVALQGRNATREKMERVIEHLLSEKRLVATTAGLLDVPGGYLARNDGPSGGAYEEDEGTWTTPDWEREYLFDPMHGRVVDDEHMHPVTRQRRHGFVVPKNSGTDGNGGNGTVDNG